MANVLENALLEKLGALRFTGPRRVTGGRVGERRSMLRGASVEIADFRAYVQGDDFRYIDWNAMARFDQPVVRLFVDQRALPVTILLDISASMDFGNPNKLRFSRRLAAALGWIGLARQDQMTLWLVGGGAGRSGRKATFVTKAGFAGLQEFVQTLKSGGRADFAGPARVLGEQGPRGGLIVVISDLLDAGDAMDHWRHLMSQGQEVRLLHVLCPQEVHPQPSQAVRLVDVETGRRMSVLPNRNMLRHYDNRVQTFLSSMREKCRHHQIPYVLLSSNAELQWVLFDVLTGAGILQR